MKSLKQSDPKNLQEITEETVKGLTSEEILGLPEIERYYYSAAEIRAIKLELISYAACKNENFSEVIINAWINEFSLLNMKPYQVVKRIRLAKHSKKYGVSEFACFMEVELNDFPELYKFKRKEITGSENNTDIVNT